MPGTRPPDPGVFSSQLEALIKESCGAPTVKYDLPEFDVIEYVNEIVPDLSALDRSQEITSVFDSELRKTNEDMHSVVTNMITINNQRGVEALPSIEFINNLYSNLNSVAQDSRDNASIINKLMANASRMNTIKKNIFSAITFCKKQESLDLLLGMIEDTLFPKNNNKSSAAQAIGSGQKQTPQGTTDGNVLSMLSSDTKPMSADLIRGPNGPVSGQYFDEIRLEEVVAPLMTVMDIINFFDVQDDKYLKSTQVPNRLKAIKERIVKVANDMVDSYSAKVVDPYRLVDVSAIVSHFERRASVDNAGGGMISLKIDMKPIDSSTDDKGSMKDADANFINNDIFKGLNISGLGSAQSVSDTNASSKDTVFHVDPLAFNDESESTTVNDDIVKVSQIVKLSKEEKEHIASAVQLVAIFGKQEASSFVDKFLAKQITPYKDIFNSNLLAAGLKGVPLRYKWVKKYISLVVDLYSSAFPKEWRVLDRFAVTWTLFTSDQIDKWLKSNNIVTPDDTVDIETTKDFLNAIFSTSDAIDYLEKIFWPDTKYKDLLNRFNENEERIYNSTHQGKVKKSVEEFIEGSDAYKQTRDKWVKRLAERKQKEERETIEKYGIKSVNPSASSDMSALSSKGDRRGESGAKARGAGDGSVPLQPFKNDLSFRQTLNSVFVNLLEIYVNNEKNNLISMIEQIDKGDDMMKTLGRTAKAINEALECYKKAEQFNTLSTVSFPCINMSNCVLDSAAKVLVLVKDSIKRCAKISNQIPLLKLTQVLNDVFSKYARYVVRKLNPTMERVRAYKAIVGAGKESTVLYGGNTEQGEFPPMYTAGYPIVPAPDESILTFIVVAETCEFMTTNITTLESQIAELIDEAFKQDISLDGTKDNFKNVQVRAFKCFAASGLAKCADALEPWARQTGTKTLTSSSGTGSMLPPLPSSASGSPTAKRPTTSGLTFEGMEGSQLLITPCVREAATSLTVSLKRLYVAFPREYNRVLCEIYTTGFLNLFARQVFSRQPMTPKQLIVAKMDYLMISNTMDTFQEIINDKLSSISRIKLHNTVKAGLETISNSVDVVIGNNLIIPYDNNGFHPNIDNATFTCKNLVNNYYKIFVKGNLASPANCLYWFNDFSKVLLKKNKITRVKLEGELRVLVTPMLPKMSDGTVLKIPVSKTSHIISKVDKGVTGMKTKLGMDEHNKNDRK